jgi:hypothetical protein
MVDDNDISLLTIHHSNKMSKTKMMVMTEESNG